ncbi:MAG: hypothetical protein RJB38_792 [Pseudomonadota bacterium]|jgi:hypothetical protein
MAKRLNPIELVIFTVVAAGFGYSAYQFLEQRPQFQAQMLAPMTSSPVSESNRSPASVAPLFGSVQFGCKSGQMGSVRASKIRISGPICGMEAHAQRPQLTGTTVVNSANQFQATVFTDLGAGRFSTDYIPLNSDKNAIRLEFKFKDGKTVSHDLLLQRE